MENNLKEIKFKKGYDSDSDDLLNEFYIPVLNTAHKYKRLAGFFSSGILAAAARGIVGLIQNDGHMQLLIGATLHNEDNTVAKDSIDNPKKYIEKALMSEISSVKDLLINEHVEALGWMLANDLLEIKFGLVDNRALFHQKVGIVEDKYGNKIAFSGSANETPSGWKHNVEEIKVYKEWVADEKDYFQLDNEKFEKYWEGKAERVKTVDLPEAIKKELIKIAPKGKENLRILKSRINLEIITPKERVVNLRPHQIKAINALKKANYRGILSMATGSGKTLTALSLAREIAKNDNICTVVAVPREHLAKQWINNDIRQLFPGVPIIEVHGGASDWRNKLKIILPGFSNGTIKKLFIVGLYGSLASDDYIEIIKKSKIDPKNFLFIADEVHNIGAPESQSGMLEEYSNRVGLSATPERYLDDEGTDIIMKYFGGVIYEYGISDAIRDGFLTPYNYYPMPIYLNYEEYEKYAEISRKISQRIAANGRNNSNAIEREDIKQLLIKRSKILKNASGKIDKVALLLRNVSLKRQNDLSHILIYCDNLKQVEDIQRILNDFNIINHKFTENESSDERKFLLDNFSQGRYQALVAVKCLDEGVDIPDSRIAIIVASTTNPREYIQRRGRVLRLAPGKTEAEIYDLLVLPPASSGDNIDRIEKSILEKEFSRVRDFVNSSKNPSSSYNELIDIMKKFKIYL